MTYTICLNTNSMLLLQKNTAHKNVICTVSYCISTLTVRARRLSPRL